MHSLPAPAAATVATASVVSICRVGLQRNDDVLPWRLLPSVRLPQIVRWHWLRRLPKRTSHLRFRHGLLLPDVLERHEVPLDGVR